jgi:hypothetical protein
VRDREGGYEGEILEYRQRERGRAKIQWKETERGETEDQTQRERQG